jgi:hypothetical protein
VPTPVDGGEVDGGTADAGVSGKCGVVQTSVTCTISSGSCQVGDACDTEADVNQGYDPCFVGVTGNQLGYRSVPRTCRDGFCGLPGENEVCSNTCLQTAGDSRRTTCANVANGSKLCLPACATDAECRGAGIFDTGIYNPQPITNLCVNNGGGAACQPVVCYQEGEPGIEDPLVLYKPCQGHPGTRCLPRYFGDASSVVGVCMAVRNTTSPTVGEACDVVAGVEASSALCGPDAVCMGGRCAAICDAATLGIGGKTPTCTDPDTACISLQGLDLISNYQVGGCGKGCHPFATLNESGCVSYCGGPPARCIWIVGDPPGGDQPRGYCGASVKDSIPTGQSCSRATSSGICESGSRCLTEADGVTQTCTRLCDPVAVAGSRDACPSGTCKAFNGLPRSGYCE